MIATTVALVNGAFEGEKWAAMSKCGSIADLLLTGGTRCTLIRSSNDRRLTRFTSNSWIDQHAGRDALLGCNQQQDQLN
jgi:hypothetical protein